MGNDFSDEEEEQPRHRVVAQVPVQPGQVLLVPSGSQVVYLAPNQGTPYYTATTQPQIPLSTTTTATTNPKPPDIQQQKPKPSSSMYPGTLPPQRTSAIPTNTPIYTTQPQAVGTQPQVVGTQPQVVATQPQVVGMQPQIVATQPIPVVTQAPIVYYYAQPTSIAPPQVAAPIIYTTAPSTQPAATYIYTVPAAPNVTTIPAPIVTTTAPVQPTTVPVQPTTSTTISPNPHTGRVEQGTLLDFSIETPNPKPPTSPTPETENTEPNPPKEPVVQRYADISVMENYIQPQEPAPNTSPSPSDAAFRLDLIESENNTEKERPSRSFKFPFKSPEAKGYAPHDDL